MLVEFTFENFKSFKDKTTFSMEPVSHNGKPVNEIETNFKDVKSVFRTAAIFGANASGKSNFIEAFMVFKKIVKKSFSNSIDSTFEIDNYMLGSKTSRDIHFEIKFIIKNNLYRYGFSLDNKKVKKEYLYITPQKTNKEKEIFNRNNKQYSYDTEIISNENWAKETIATRLFLSELVNNRNVTNYHIFYPFLEITGSLQLKFNTIIDNKDTLFSYIMNKKDTLINFMNKVDFNIKNIRIKRPSLKSVLLDPNGIEIMSTHKTENGKEIEVKFNTFESEGTKVAFALSGQVISALSSGATLIVDELDRSLHPLLVKHIVNLFNNPETNPLNAQLIFTSHAHYLMDGETLSRDQIWLTSKENGFSSQLYSLGDFKELTRKKDNFYNEYMYGIFGAVPNIKED